MNPDEWALKAGLNSCSRLTLRNEMRKVKFMLDWKDSRETEFRLAKLRRAREERDRAASAAVMMNQSRPYVRIEVPKEPMSEEEKAVSSQRCFQLKSCKPFIQSIESRWWFTTL